MKKNILVVDDSALMRRVICDIINAGNEYEATDTGKDGLEAYDKIKNNNYDAVLLDINMPRMNGLELLQKLQKENIRATVIVVSSLAKEDAKITIQAMEYGAIDFITKPENIIEAKGVQFRESLTRLLDSVLPQVRTRQLSPASAKPAGAARQAGAAGASGTAKPAGAPAGVAKPSGVAGAPAGMAKPPATSAGAAKPSGAAAASAAAAAAAARATASTAARAGSAASGSAATARAASPASGAPARAGSPASGASTPARAGSLASGASTTARAAASGPSARAGAGSPASGASAPVRAGSAASGSAATARTAPPASDASQAADSAATAGGAQAAANAPASTAAPRVAARKSPSGGGQKLVALACSTGGPKSLQSVIPYLDKNMDAPVVLVQHMPMGFTKSMAERLNELSKVEVKEAEENDVLKKGCVYVAPGGSHLEVVPSGGGAHKIHLSDAPAIGGLRPCANVMYKSLKRSAYDEIVCVVLTGMGADGTDGIRELNRAKPIYVIAQDEPTCVVYGMPKAIAEAGLTDEVVPLSNIPKRIINQVGVK